jgi:hypothetical protein
VVESTGLENRQACKRLVGSNPTPSAISSYKRVYENASTKMGARNRLLKQAVSPPLFSYLLSKYWEHGPRFLAVVEI